MKGSTEVVVSVGGRIIPRNVPEYEAYLARRDCSR